MEQIDSLASIATAFSNLARLPGTQLADIAPLEIMQHAVQLYPKTKQIRIELNGLPLKTACRGDREQCMRVFNNLLNNALEALEQTPDPWIRVRASVQEGK